MKEVCKAQCMNVDIYLGLLGAFSIFYFCGSGNWAYVSNMLGKHSAIELYP